MMPKQNIECANLEMTNTWLIYHPKRVKTKHGKITIFHDKIGKNEDPYIWNKQFLHTFCHITQLPNQISQINFWVSGDKYPNFTKLHCDCVFVIAEKHFWTHRNQITRLDPIVDNDQTFAHHYNWVNLKQHYFKRKRRYTLKADSEKSFQPQDTNGNLIDILPFLNSKGIETQKLINAMTTKRGSKPTQIDRALGHDLYKYLYEISAVKLYGDIIKTMHP